MLNDRARLERVRRERDLLRHINKNMALELAKLRAALEQALAQLHHHSGCDAECEKRHPEALRVSSDPENGGWRSSHRSRSAG